MQHNVYTTTFLYAHVLATSCIIFMLFNHCNSAFPCTNAESHDQGRPPQINGDQEIWTSNYNTGVYTTPYTPSSTFAQEVYPHQPPHQQSERSRTQPKSQHREAHQARQSLPQKLHPTQSLLDPWSRPAPKETPLLISPKTHLQTPPQEPASQISTYQQYRKHKPAIPRTRQRRMKINNQLGNKERKPQPAPSQQDRKATRPLQTITPRKLQPPEVSQGSPGYPRRRGGRLGNFPNSFPLTTTLYSKSEIRTLGIPEICIQNTGSNKSRGEIRNPSHTTERESLHPTAPQPTSKRHHSNPRRSSYTYKKAPSDSLVLSFSVFKPRAKRETQRRRRESTLEGSILSVSTLVAEAPAIQKRERPRADRSRVAKSQTAERPGRNETIDSVVATEGGLRNAHIERTGAPAKRGPQKGRDTSTKAPTEGEEGSYITELPPEGPRSGRDKLSTAPTTGEKGFDNTEAPEGPIEGPKSCRRGDQITSNQKETRKGSRDHRRLKPKPNYRARSPSTKKEEGSAPLKASTDSKRGSASPNDCTRGITLQTCTERPAPKVCTGRSAPKAGSRESCSGETAPSCNR
jgi:hypothetical protein